MGLCDSGVGNSASERINLDFSQLLISVPVIASDGLEQEVADTGLVEVLSRDELIKLTRTLLSIAMITVLRKRETGKWYPRPR